MKETFFLSLKKNFEDKNFNIQTYDELFDNYLHYIKCPALKCQKLVQFRRSIDFLLEEHKSLFGIKNRNEEVFFQILHDIKSPMLSIKFALEGTQRCHLEDEIYKINSDTLDIIHNFLSIYSFENGNSRLVYEIFDIKELIKSQIEIYKYSAKCENLGIIFDGKHCKNPAVYSEKSLVQRILINLITNAIKYAKKNTDIKISLKCAKEFIKIGVTNRFEHIKMQKTEEMFEKFNTSNEEGSFGSSFGLGLYICKRLCRKINSEIIAKKLGNSITFEFKIPKSRA